MEHKYWLLYDERTVGGLLVNPGEPYSNRETSYTTVQFKSLVRTNLDLDGDVLLLESDCDIRVEDLSGADTAYLVVVTYSDGDSFGRDEGKWQVPFVTPHLATAMEVKKDIEDSGDSNDFRESYGIYAHWTGYFCSVDNVDVLVMPIQNRLTSEVCK